jgi:nitroimidazol reductase NimA-like FMN-containing flavoprotein (pyridoxamine 5'-phosphate oxidase superfamily)
VQHDEVIAVLEKPISQRLLGSDVPARLAYTGLDGDPRGVPVAFWWGGAQLVVCTVPAAAKARALRRHPRVAVTIDTQGGARGRPRCVPRT